MRAERIRKTRKNEIGQSLVEFALVVPLLLFLVIGIFEFGRAWMTKNLVTGAAREAVRMYAVKDDTVTADARADNILSGSLDLSRRTISHTMDNNTVTVSYTITYDFPTVIVGFIPGLDNIMLSSTTTMRKEY
jgi:Flp pilus assembly protein TadG